MAFPTAANYGNLPNGVFSPVIFSKKAQLQFRKTSVVEAITNSEYFGEISSYGDTVRIIKEPEITVRKHERGTQLEAQDLEDNDFMLIVDQSNYFMFGVDDIEKQQSHVDWIEMASNRAAYEMADNYDEEVLGYLSGYELTAPLKEGGVWQARTAPNGTIATTGADPDELLPANKLDASAFGGSAGNAIKVGVEGTFDATPLQILNRFNRRFNQLNVPKEGRWVVMDPIFVEKLMDENSKLVNALYAPNEQGNEGLFNGRLSAGKIRGFEIYESNNLPFLGNGAGDIGGDLTADFGIIVAGHSSAVATASQINSVEKYRDPLAFRDVVRGMNLYGRKILRGEGLIRAAYQVNA